MTPWLLHASLIILMFYGLVFPAPIRGEEAILTSQAATVTQEFRYRMSEAGEVYLLWGVNDWKTVPEQLRPEGTVLRKWVMYSPMQVRGNAFTVKLQVPSGSIIDYLFHITETRHGASIDLWDSNGDQDYHTVATQDGAVEIKSTLTLARAEQRDFSILLPLLFGMCLILLATALVPNQQTPVNPNVKILCMGLSLCFFLVVIRANIMGYGWISLRSSLVLAPKVLLAGYYDLVYVSIISASFLVLLVLFRKNQKAQNRFYSIFLGIAMLSLLIAFLNIKIVQMLGTPFNYQWLYYSDFLNSLDAHNAMLSNLSWNLLANVVALAVAMIIVSRLLNRGISLLLHKYNLGRILVIAAVSFLLIYFPLANWYISNKNWNHLKLANPVASFLGSVINSRQSPKLFTMKTTLGSEDFETVLDETSENHAIQNPGKSGIKNIIIVVLESVAAEYIEAYGGTYPTTPELNRYIQQSALFENIYAHAPTTNYSMVSILGSIYPWISYRSLTQEYPDVTIPTLSAELKNHGYRTAFFNASDNRFQSADKFLSHRQFDKIEDYRSLNCKRQKFDREREGLMEGVDDLCIFDSFVEWAGRESERPFFAMMWTYQTHYPYFVVGNEIDFGVEDKTLNRYLNALHHGDEVLGNLLRWLQGRNILESTLVVLVGDHGEAFGRHDQWVHASRIYEENIHVPFILINPALFSGEKFSTIGGLIDIAPTVMDILDLPPSDKWQGRSLFQGARTGRVYFFAPWSGLRFGYRDGNLKLIFDASNNTSEVYDLEKDPRETENLAKALPEFAQEGHQRLAAWVQFQDRFFRDLLANGGGQVGASAR
jgi:phosphoglycerol transferase MdoB-like AlkP superfamily enzyme